MREVRPAGLVRHDLGSAVRWAKVHHVAWHVSLGPLTRAVGRTLLANYTVTRAVLVRVARSHRQKARPVLEARASQGRSHIGAVVAQRPPICQPAAGSQVVFDGPRVRVVEDLDLGASPSFPSYVACQRTTGRQKLLYGVQQSGEGYFDQLDGVQVAGDTVGLANVSYDKYNDCMLSVEIYDFDTGAPPSVFQNNCNGREYAEVGSLVVNDKGFAAWTIDAPTASSALFVHDGGGTRQIDTGTITNLALSESTLTWTNSGTARQATLN